MKWIAVTQTAVSASGKTKVFRVDTLAGHMLGEITWHAPWRKYAFNPLAETCFDHACLRELADFCETATRDHRERT